MPRLSGTRPHVILRRSADERGRLVCVLIGLAVLLSIVILVPESAASAAPARKVLVFSKTAGFRHSSIPSGIAAITELGRNDGFAVDATEDPTRFTGPNLSQYQAVIWLSTTGDVLTITQQRAFEGYLAAGGGFVGVHAAADTEYDWPWYGGLVGSYFSDHPAIQPAALRVEDRSSAATAHLSTTWNRTDEWYNFQTNPRTQVKVLISLDEASYSGASMGDHPIAWCQNYGGGRAFYTGLGHSAESYQDADFTAHLLGGIKIAAGWVVADCEPDPQSLISLRAKANNRYVTAESAGAGPLIANRPAVGQWEHFDLVERGGDTVALRAHANYSYVCAEAGGTQALIANRGSLGAWETFILIRNPDGTVSLLASANGKFVTAEKAGAAPLIANRDAIALWEKFDLIGVRDAVADRHDLHTGND
jgi:type 1 glutamine amidotransferase